MTSIKRSTTLSLACGALLALALGSVAFATHGRPGGGETFKVPLVVAYNQCGDTPTAEDPSPSVFSHTHVTPLSYQSCAPQAQKRSGANPHTLTMTTTGGCGGGCTSLGTWRLDVINAAPGGAPEDVSITVGSITGVKCNIVGTGTNGSCGAVGANYDGLLLAQSVHRITDHSNAATPNDVCPGGTGASPCVTGTVRDLNYTIPLSCTAGTCGPVATTYNVHTGAGTVRELQRGNVAIKNVRVMSPGNDFSFGAAPFPGTGDEEKFMEQGLFWP